MRNTYVIAAVLAVGLVAPVAFLAGQYVSQQNERTANTSLNLGDGGNGLDGLPGGDGPNTTSFSFGCSQPSGVYGGVHVEGGIGALGDPEAAGKHFKEALLTDHRQQVDVEAFLVPPDWDGLVSGKRMHSPLTMVEGSDVSSPKLFLAISRGEDNESTGTRAMDVYLKLGAIVEPGAVAEISDLDDQDHSIGGRIWVNFSLSYAKIQMEEKMEEAFSAYIELPGTWMSNSSVTDKSSPMLRLAVAAHPDVAGTHDDAEFALDFSMVFEDDVMIEVGSFPLMEDISFTFRHMELVGWNLERNKPE